MDNEEKYLKYLEKRCKIEEKIIEEALEALSQWKATFFYHKERIEKCHTKQLSVK